MAQPSLSNSIRSVLRHPDTSRCLQGAVIVAQEVLRAGKSCSPNNRLASHIHGIEQVVDFFVARGVQGESNPAAPTTNQTSSYSPIIRHEPKTTTTAKPETIAAEGPKPAREIPHRGNLHENAVPSSRLGRVFGFGQLAAGLAVGSVGEVLKRVTSSEGSGSMNEVMLNEANAERIASTLCRMRGAALKLGQMLSIQDETVLSPQLSAALERVRQNADVMPLSQLETVMSAELGKEWRGLFDSFNDRPFAAASLGQVHQAVVNSVPVAVKVQFPGVAESIDSDLANLKRLASVTGIFPKGLFIDRIIEVMKQELREECNYEAEAKHQERFRKLLEDERDVFFVPKVIPEASSRRVLTTELAYGLPIDQVVDLPQDVRNSIGRKLLRLTLRELFEFRYMQTDPNFSNYLYDPVEQKLVLLDFGATHSFAKSFVDDYMELVWAASNSNRSDILHYSIKLGFLTGEESQQMVNAHIEAGLEVGRPFQRAGDFNFRESRMTAQMGKHGDTFVNERLTPPPREVYSLHRRLSGAYMTCIRIGAVFSCRDLLEDAYHSFKR